MGKDHEDPAPSPFRICLNGLTVRECSTEPDAIDAAIQLRRGVAGAAVTIVNLRTGIVVEVTPEHNRGARPLPRRP
jgi:nitrous oxidase accessory protein NosD